MLYILAILFPPAVHFIADKPGEGIISLSVLVLTCGCGWPFLAGWAFWAVGQHLNDQRNKELIDAISRTGRGRR